MVEFSAGGVVSKWVPVRHPQPIRLKTFNPSISDYREIRQSSGDLIRPLLLAPADLKDLRPFQLRGVEWLVDNERGILADDMGLGKTVQAISALRILFRTGLASSALVLCPKSLLTNWEEEFSRWAPELSRLRVVPSGHIRDEAWQIILGKVHVVLTNYEQMRDPPEVLLKLGTDVVIADEAHHIRKVGSLVAQGIRRLKWRRFWALTGTPIERDPADLATLLSTIEPDRYSVSDKVLHPASLRAQVRPYILRRLKSEVLAELPEVLESKQTLDLLPSQRSAYRRVIGRLGREDESGILAAINQLRTLCDYDERTGNSSKADRILEILQEIQHAEEKAVVFSYLLRPLEILVDRISRVQGRHSAVQLRGDMSPAARDEVLLAFKSKPEVTTLLCSSRIGGEGLTLTEANHVIFFNEWWNPSANIQARDRVVRIGQRRGVRVYSFKCKDTIEENLEVILESKSKIMVDLVDRLAESSIKPDQSQILKDLRDNLISRRED